MILSDGKKKSILSRLPSREELALWRHVVADVTPGPRKAGRKPQLGEPALAAHKPLLAALAPSLAAPAPSPATPMVVHAAPAEKPHRRDPPPLAPLERKLRRDLAAGRAPIDDRIDLHGMTQAQAHGALMGFMHRAFSRDARVVLVITGKGGPSSDGHGERGVLRRAAPLWLREPGMRSLVLSVEEAARPHGGGGAFYVRLRRQRGGQPQGT